MVGYPKDVEETYFGESGIFSKADDHHILIDMTTSIAPTLGQENSCVFGKERSARWMLQFLEEIRVLKMERSQRWSVVRKERLMPLKERSVFSSKVMLQGPAGSGQHTKMANQIMVAGTMTGMTELLVYSKAAGLDLERVIEQVAPEAPLTGL